MQKRLRVCFSNLSAMVRRTTILRLNVTPGRRLCQISIIGALEYFLFSRWLSANLFWPIVLITAVILAVVCGLIFPVELSYRELDDDSDSITPAERVKQRQAETENRD